MTGMLSVAAYGYTLYRQWREPEI